jgi:hypothetical protein
MNPDPFQPGYRLIDGDELNDVVANPVWSVSGNVTATVGGTVATSAKVVYTVTNLTTVNAAGAGVVIPQALPGRVLIIVNRGLFDAQIFAEDGSVIDGVPGNLGIPLMVNMSIVLIAVDVGVWISIATTALNSALPLSNGESEASLLHFTGTTGTVLGADSWLQIVQDDLATNHNDTQDPIAIAYMGAYWFDTGIAWAYAKSVLAAYYGWNSTTADARILTAQQYAYSQR